MRAENARYCRPVLFYDLDRKTLGMRIATPTWLEAVMQLAALGEAPRRVTA